MALDVSEDLINWLAIAQVPELSQSDCLEILVQLAKTGPRNSLERQTLYSAPREIAAQRHLPVVTHGSLVLKLLYEIAPCRGGLSVPAAPSLTEVRLLATRHLL